MKKSVKQSPWAGCNYKGIRLEYYMLLCMVICLGISSCSVTRQVSKKAQSTLLKDSAVQTGHTGISIYETATGKYWFNHNATHYFIPASNAKLFTLYAGMKYLGDSLVGGYYQNFSDTAINFIVTGDPGFLHPDFTNQPVLEFFKKEKRKIYVSGQYNDEALGYGWAWDDYNDNYMAERNIFPAYGNLVKISVEDFKRKTSLLEIEPIWKTIPNYFKEFLPQYLSPFSFSGEKENIKIEPGSNGEGLKKFELIRNRLSNNFHLKQSNSKFSKQEIPFYTDNLNTTVNILQKDYGISISRGFLGDNNLKGGKPDQLAWHPIKTQPSDALFKLMMHRSDNFFAEQTLIMASKRGWNNLSEKNETLVLIDTVLKLHLNKLTHRPKWVDGSGLSRYNLFTPQSFVQLLNQLQLEFGLERLKTILPTGGKGTLTNYYKKNAGQIFAKTGTLSNNCALSGFLYTKKGKLLIFSVLNNNYITGAAPVRRAVEKFLEEIIEKY